MKGKEHNTFYAKPRPLYRQQNTRYPLQKKLGEFLFWP
jgi:hypothetical protein